MIELREEDMRDLYKYLDGEYCVDRYAVDTVSYSDIIEIANFLRNRDYV